MHPKNDPKNREKLKTYTHAAGGMLKTHTGCIYMLKISLLIISTFHNNMLLNSNKRSKFKFIMYNNKHIEQFICMFKPRMLDLSMCKNSTSQFISMLHIPRILKRPTILIQSSDIYEQTLVILFVFMLFHLLRL